jgi:hypothetical protein
VKRKAPSTADFRKHLPKVAGWRWRVTVSGNGWTFYLMRDALKEEKRTTENCGWTLYLLFRTWDIYKEKFNDNEIRILLGNKIARQQRLAA